MSRNKGSLKAKRKRTDSEKLELFVSKVSELRNTRLAKERFHMRQGVAHVAEMKRSFFLCVR